MLTDINQYISSCTVYAQAKVPNTLPANKLMPLSSPQWPWSYIPIKFITDLPVSKENTVIMVVIDSFFKLLHLIPLPGLPKSFKTSKLILNYVFKYFGTQEDIVSDHGTHFTLWIWSIWSSFIEELGVLFTLTSENQEDWTWFLPCLRML